MAPTETGVPAAGDALLRWRCDGAVLGLGGGERSRRGRTKGLGRRGEGAGEPDGIMFVMGHTGTFRPICS